MPQVKFPVTLRSALAAEEIAQRVFSGDQLYAIRLALSIVDSYLAEAALLRARMNRAHRRIGSDFARLANESSHATDWRGGRRRPTFPFQAVHFYANCWTIIGQHLVVIRDVAGFPSVGQALRQHLKAFQRYRAVRDHYEHLDERLPGRRNERRLRVKNDLGNLEGTILSIGGEKVDVGPASLQTLRRVVRDVVRAFKLAALEKLAPQEVGSLVRRIQGRRLSRTLRRMST